MFLFFFIFRFHLFLDFSLRLCKSARSLVSTQMRVHAVANGQLHGIHHFEAKLRTGPARRPALRYPGSSVLCRNPRRWCLSPGPGAVVAAAGCCPFQLSCAGRSGVVLEF